MNQSEIESVLRRVVSKHAKVTPDILVFVASVLADLAPEELADFQEVRKLLEPCLLDALKPGRERPHDRKSDALVETLCREVHAQLNTANQNSVSKLVDHPSGSTDREPFELSLTHIEEAVRRALLAFHAEAVLPNAEVAALASACMDLTQSELDDTDVLKNLLEPVMLDAFHDIAEWTAEEDQAQLQHLSQLLRQELKLLFACTRSPALMEGATVILQDLVSRPELNGRKGTLVKFDTNKSRWQVRLGSSVMLFKENNLQVVCTASLK